MWIATVRKLSSSLRPRADLFDTCTRAKAAYGTYSTDVNCYNYNLLFFFFFRCHVRIVFAVYDSHTAQLFIRVVQRVTHSVNDTNHVRRRR